MGNKISFHSVFAVAKIEYIKWLTNPRIIIVGVFLIFMRNLVIEPLLERAAKMQISLSALEPFVAIGNSGMLVMLIPGIFLALLGDYPILGDGIFHIVQRSQKINWFLGQLIFLLLAIVTFLGIIMIGSIVMTGGEFKGSWSDAVTKYDSLYPGEAGNFTSQLLPSNLYNQIPLPTAAAQTFILLVAYLFMLALVIYLFKLLKTGPLGMVTACIMIGMGVVTCSLKQPFMWIFPMANTIIWLHYEKILQEQIFPVWYSFSYFIIGIVIFLTGNILALRRLQFINSEIN